MLGFAVAFAGLACGMLGFILGGMFCDRFLHPPLAGKMRDLENYKARTDVMLTIADRVKVAEVIGERSVAIEFDELLALAGIESEDLDA